MHKCYHTGAVFVRQAQNCDCLHLVTKHLFLPEAVQLPQMGQSSALIGTMHCGVPTPMLAFPVPWHFFEQIGRPHLELSAFLRPSDLRLLW